MNKLRDFTFRASDGRKHHVRMLFQDAEILVVEKPAGLRVIPDHWTPDLPNLKALLEDRLHKSEDPRSRVWVVHRIDMDTSGAVIFARDPRSHQLLNDAFAENRIQKTYLAIVEGRPSPDAGEIDLPIDTQRRKGKVRIHPEGKSSRTEYRILETFRRFSLLEIQLKTGRTHQIRVHLQAIGHPLAVDPLYSGVERLGIADLKPLARSGFAENPTALISRLTLHAWRLRFRHPLNGELLQIEAPPPKDFSALLKALRKWDRAS